MRPYSLLSLSETTFFSRESVYPNAYFSRKSTRYGEKINAKKKKFTRARFKSVYVHISRLDPVWHVLNK